MRKIIQGMIEAIRSAKCDHAFVMTPTQPEDRRAVRLFCPRCEGTFTFFDEPPMSGRQKTPIG